MDMKYGIAIEVFFHKEFHLYLQSANKKTAILKNHMVILRATPLPQTRSQQSLEQLAMHFVQIEGPVLL